MTIKTINQENILQVFKFDIVIGQIRIGQVNYGVPNIIFGIMYLGKYIYTGTIKT